MAMQGTALWMQWQLGTNWLLSDWAPSDMTLTIIN